MSIDFKKFINPLVDVFHKVGSTERDIAKKVGTEVKNDTIAIGNKVLQARDVFNKVLTPHYSSPEEALGQGALPVKQADGSYRYVDLTGSGTIENVGNEAKSVFKPIISKVAEKISPTAERFATEVIDRFAPIKNFVKDKSLSAESDPYIAARNFAGRFGKIQNRLDNLREILLPAKNDLTDIKQYGLLERFDELAKRGVTKFPDNLTPEQILKDKTALEAKLGDKLPVVHDTLGKLRGYSNSLLAEAKDAGIISNKSYEAILKNNEKYLPLQRLEYLADQADNLPRGSKSFSVATQDIVKGIKGSTKEVLDPIQGIIRNTYKTVNLIERNRVAQKVANLATNEAFKDLVVPLEGKAAVPAGMDKISVFQDGIKNEFAVPKELADSLKGLNEKNIDIVTQLAGKMGGLLRAGATSLNVGFIPSNAIRDFQTATLVSKVGFTPWDWLKGFAEAVRRGPDYQRYLESGASFSGYFEQAKNLEQTAKQLTESKASQVIKTIVNPVKLLQTVGETIELSPRLGVFKRSLGKGLSEAEAAFNAREATVDFAKSGSAMKVANLWVPFLNARTQGTINALNSIKQNPVHAAAVIGAMIEIPTIATYFNNTKFHKDIWDNIAQFEKDSNFILIYGDHTDDSGNPTQVVKIPKGDVGKVFGNPVENFLEYLNHNDPKGFAQVVEEMFSNVSPVDFVRDGNLSGQAVLSGVLPPTVKAGVESSTNTNLYTGRQIVPDSLKDASPAEQYTEKTSPLAVKLGRYLGVSPMKLENAIGTQFGGLGRQVINPGSFGKQVSGRFVGAVGGEQMNKDFEALQQAKTENTDVSVEAKRKAKILVNQLKDLPVSQRREYVNDQLQQGKIDVETLKALGNEIDAQAKNLDSFERSFSGQPNEVKAKFLIQKLQSLPKEKRRQYFEDLAAKGLITEQLLKDLAQEVSSER